MISPITECLNRERGTVSVISSITGRRIEVNTSLTRFALLPGWDAARLARAQEDWESVQKVRSRRATRESRNFVAPLFRAESRETFGDALEEMICRVRWSIWHHYPARRSQDDITWDARYSTSSGAANQIAEALTLLWKHEFIVAPTVEIASPSTFAGKAVPLNDEEHLGVAASIIASLIDLPKLGRSSRGVFVRFFLTTSGVREIGDMDRDVLLALGSALNGQRGVVDGVDLSRLRHASVNQLLGALQRAQARAYMHDPESLRLIPSSYLNLRVVHKGTVNYKGRGDPRFQWVAREHPEQARWGDAAAEFITTLRNRVDLTSECRNLDVLMNDLFGSGEVPDSPVAFCARAFGGPAILEATLAQREAASQRKQAILRSARSFFEWVLTRYARSDEGEPDVRYHNPVDQVPLPRRGARRGQTHRLALPPWLLREIRDVLADESWARTQQADYFYWVEPESGLTTRVWSPVRLEATRLRLLLPLRTLQTQLLDSGEGDSLVWEASEANPLDGKWVDNTGPWAPPPGERRQNGFLRPIYDPDAARYLTGLYISTNKSADRADDFTAPGYEIPYESADVIALVLRLVQFQKRYNPTRGPLKRTELTSQNGVRASSPDVSAVLPGLHYLFRDPAMPRLGSEPATRSRLLNFWHALMDHVESRLKSREGSGRHVELITNRNAQGKPHGCVFDLHSLRVSGLTELAMAGCPVQVLMMLAGHATWVMTLYYVKPSAADIDRELTGARERAGRQTADSWEDYVASGALDELRSLVIANEDEILSQQRTDFDAALAQVMDYGECPNGATLCGVGGPRLARGGRDGDKHGPVPGGASNCTTCRFFVTGPFYLGGLIARLNALSVDLEQAGSRLRKAEKQRRAAVAECEGTHTNPPARTRLARATAAVDEAEAAAVDVSQSWLTTYRLIERSKTAIRERTTAEASTSEARSERLPVILNGTADDLRVSFEVCTDYDLWSRVCEDSEFYPSTDASVASMRRALRLDRMLAEAGSGAVFAGLSDEERLFVGNVYARWLRTRLGAPDHTGLITGKRTLRDFGLVEESDTLLREHHPMHIPQSALRPSKPLATSRDNSALLTGVAQDAQNARLP